MIIYTTTLCRPIQGSTYNYDGCIPTWLITSWLHEVGFANLALGAYFSLDFPLHEVNIGDAHRTRIHGYMQTDLQLMI